MKPVSLPLLFQHRTEQKNCLKLKSMKSLPKVLLVQVLMCVLRLTLSEEGMCARVLKSSKEDSRFTTPPQHPHKDQMLITLCDEDQEAIDAVDDVEKGVLRKAQKVMMTSSFNAVCCQQKLERSHSMFVDLYVNN